MRVNGTSGNISAHRDIIRKIFYSINKALCEFDATFNTMQNL